MFEKSMRKNEQKREFGTGYGENGKEDVLFTHDLGLLVTSENDLRQSIYSLNTVATKYVSIIEYWKELINSFILVTLCDIKEK
jgi:hypothetical protein